MIQKDIRIVKGFGEVCSGQRTFIIIMIIIMMLLILCISFGHSFTPAIRTELQ